MEGLEKFLSSHRSEKGSEYTHTSMGPPAKGAFYIPQPELPEFLRLYKRVIESGNRLHITEKHKDVCPVVIDIDFRFPASVGTLRQYTTDHIKKIVSYYQSEIRNSFMGDVTAYVYEKGTEGRLLKTKIKDGMHIMFPGIITYPQAQLVMRRKVIKRIKEDNIFDDMPLTNDEWDIFDEAVIEKNVWTMYGSCKTDDQHVYNITHIFDDAMDERPIPEARNLVDILSIRNKSSEDRVDFINEDIQKEYDEIYKSAYKSKTKNVSVQTIGIDEHELTKIQKLVNLIDPKRADEYASWVELGWCLHNINSGLLPVWEEFSKKSDKYEDGKCAEIWNKARADGGLNMGTLYYWARHDSPEEYEKFKKDNVYSEIIASLKQNTDYAIAKVLHMMFGHKYVLASIKDKCWYEFVGHHWKPCEQGIFLRKKISKDLYDAYRSAHNNWNEKYSSMSPEQQEDEQAKHAEINGQFATMYHKLRTTKHKNDVMKSAEELFYYDDRYDKKFLEKLDSNRDLIGFENGVYDLSAVCLDNYGKVIYDGNGNEVRGVFREGKPSDYVSLSCRINYVPLDVDSEEVFRCKKFINDIFPDEDMRDYVMTLFSYCLSGHISEEKLWMMIGQCLAPGTKVKMFDGSYKNVEDVVVGDVVMGDDRTPRNVESVTSGECPMYRITPKNNINPYTVTWNHVLSLKANNYIKSVSDTASPGDVVDISLVEYMKKSVEWRVAHSGFRINVEHPELDDELYSFNVQHVGIDQYHGFALDGNHRFVIEDGTVTHNSSNGKSAMLELFKCAFGDYFKTVSPKILTTKRGSPEGASPELAKLKGARFVAISEPEKDDIIQGGFTKLLSGGDDISCRSLYKDPISYKPQFTLILLSNYFLQINTTDEGIFRRLRAVECKVKFCDNPEDGNKYQAQIDRKLKNNFPDWAEAFMSILIEYYTNIYAKDGLKEPEEVKVYTKKYQQDVDVFLEYIDENIVEISGNVMSLSNVYGHFKSWFKEQTDSGKAPTRKDLKGVMEKKFGPAKKHRNAIGWLGIGMADEEVLEEETDTVIVDSSTIEELS